MIFDIFCLQYSTAANGGSYGVQQNVDVSRHGASFAPEVSGSDPVNSAQTVQIPAIFTRIAAGIRVRSTYIVDKTWLTCMRPFPITERLSPRVWCCACVRCMRDSPATQSLPATVSSASGNRSTRNGMIRRA